MTHGDEMDTPFLVRRDEQPYAVVHAGDYFGALSYDLASPPRRVFDPQRDRVVIEPGVDARRTASVSTPAESLSADHASWLGRSRAAQRRLAAVFLVAEDPQGRLEAREAASLLHQLSLVQHVLSSPNLKSVLIADEVGLGKTIEAGFLISRELERYPTWRVLYLSPARLVGNVVSELREKLGIDARQWSATDTDARLDSDQVIVASLQKAVHPANFGAFAGNGPWDMLVVDECHHLSDWGEDGGKPNQGFRLVRDLIRGMSESGRVVLMSGTPNQGHKGRFKNILKLLARKGDSDEMPSGRVIYRVKDKVVDWHGKPLFPRRDVRQTRVISPRDIGEGFLAWYEDIASLYDRPGEDGAARRAAGWAKGQALQWAASSVQAGLGVLTRLGIRRLRWNVDRPELSAALAALRPYRGGNANEPIPLLFERILKQVGVQQSSYGAELLDEEFYDTEEWIPDADQLAALLVQGVKLVRQSASDKKWEHVAGLVEEANDEKMVFFAQPVETVGAFANFLHRRFGEEPALITGGQSSEERSSQIREFWRIPGARFLVSSSAGGEGINLQCAHWLVHLDVPWNPMVLEQRIGRVHRFGSRKTVVVDTIVLDETREADAYRVAREKLWRIAQQLNPEEFEALFSRVMSLIPASDFEGILVDAERGPISDETETLIGRLVSEGYEQWEKFNARFQRERQEIAALRSGSAEWSDLGAYLVEFEKGEPFSGASRLTFAEVDGNVIDVDEELPAVRADGHILVCADVGGMPITVNADEPCRQAGTNAPGVREKIQQAFQDCVGIGGSFLRSKELLGMIDDSVEEAGLLFFLSERIRIEHGVGHAIGMELNAYFLREQEEPLKLEDDTLAHSIRLTVSAVRHKSPVQTPLLPLIRAAERELWEELRKPPDDDIQAGVRHAVWPLFAAVVTR